MKKRFVQVGTGGRARFFYTALAKTYSETSELVAICDINKVRMEYTNNVLVNDLGYHPVRMYGADEFDKMIETEKPDVVIVTTIDRTHHRYIKRAMELGCDVISEKPMTVDTDKCNQILDAIEETGKHLRVTFNYRYAPHNSLVRELIMKDTIGKVQQVHFEWTLNTSHGADYFRRWHRDKRNSGGLLVHKSTHHFDLVNFWLDTYPDTVYAMGGLKFYGRENAEERGITKFYTRVHGSENANLLAEVTHLEHLALHATLAALEHATGYLEIAEAHGLCLAELVNGNFLHRVVVLQIVLHVHDVLQA